MNITINDKCIECNACAQVCKAKAIILKPNEEGFSYPVVDTDRCSDCGLCVKVCPALNSGSIKNPAGKFYAAQNKNKSVLAQSSSGGLFSAIAENVIAKGGIAYGAAWDKNLCLHHTGIADVKELYKLRGSKYVHSEIGNTYIEVRENLKKGREVYFVGTPCQVAGLKLFLRKDYTNLITSDLICHGTPSQKIFNMFVRQMAIDRNETIIDYNFRDKRVFGWTCASSSSSSVDSRGRNHYIYYDRNMRSYFNAFLNGHITRQECYECPFACMERVGDITLADYWGIRKHHPEFPDIKEGVSMIIVNTTKGEQMLKEVESNLVLANSTVEHVLNTTNHNLHSPTPKPKEREGSYLRAFSDFIAFRDYYLVGNKPESYYRKFYFKKKIKNILRSFTLGNLILKK